MHRMHMARAVVVLHIIWTSLHPLMTNTRRDKSFHAASRKISKAAFPGRLRCKEHCLRTPSENGAHAWSFSVLNQPRAGDGAEWFA